LEPDIFRLISVLKACLKITILLIVTLSCFHQNSSAQDSLSVKSEKKRVKPEFKAEPQRATMLALTFPGFGQIYNRKFWKVPFVYAGFGGLIYAVGFNSSLYIKYMRAYQDFIDNIPETDSYLELLYFADPKDYDPVLYPNSANPSYYAHYKEQMLNGINGYKKYRDLSYIGIALWYVVTILDANVDASLFNYDISDNLNLVVTPVQIPSNATGVGLNISMLVNF
jgi:hypothetical protein